MRIAIDKLSPLTRAYLAEVFEYHKLKKSTPVDAEISKRVFDYVKAGQLELAAVEAGKNDVTLEIWTKAVDAAEI